MSMLEYMAANYLRRRGFVVLERTFIGVVLGYCHALRQGNELYVTSHEQTMPLKIISINGSTVYDQDD